MPTQINQITLLKVKHKKVKLTETILKLLLKAIRINIIAQTT